MRIRAEMDCDVLVIGSGLAGIMAAIAAAEAGSSVLLSSTGLIFSGSSFFEGTWGLGCIAASSPADENDLADTILKVGCGVADERLVRALVHDAPHALADLERRGVRLRDADASEEREYIPCFDHAHRTWRGLERASLMHALGGELFRLGVGRLPRHILIDLIEEGQQRVDEPPERRTRIIGAVLYDIAGKAYRAVSAPAVVLATGGMGGLYRSNLVRADCLGSAQAVALAHGEELVNIEFLQFMPTVITPKGPMVFNEKCFRFSTLSLPVDEALLDERSTYGPFTARLAAREVDFAIARAGKPVFVQVNRLPSHVPEFIRTYRSWYERATGLALEAPIELRHSAHASNGGIAIDENGACRLPGLFAAGECAGGMHGADRIGGLASASALVFGRRAGSAAAASATRAARCFEVGYEPVSSVAVATAETMLGITLDTSAGIIRTGADLARADRIIEAQMHNGALPLLQRQRLRSARALLSAMHARTESLGSHFRADAPADCR